MMREALPSQSAKFSLLQLALPAKPILNIGILLFDPARNRVYKKLRLDWGAIADPENAEVLKAIDEDIDLTDHMNDAIKSLKIVIAADKSIHTGQVVAI